MKKNKIIGIAIASIGMLASTGAAIALYEKGVANVHFDIGAATHTTSTSTVDYKINNTASEDAQHAVAVAPVYYKNDGQTSGGTRFDDQYNCVKYEFALGGSFAEDVVAQNFVMGNLAVSLTGVHASLQGHLEASMYFTGYIEKSLGAHHYGTNLTTGESVAINNTTINGSSLSVNSKNICVSADGSQTFVIFLRLVGVDVLSMNEATSLWNLSVTWGAPDNDYVAAYVANTKTLFAEDDEFIMTPNINKTRSENQDWDDSAWEWTAAIKGTAQITQAKCRKEDSPNPTIWEGPDNQENHSLTLNTVYDVYWDGNHGNGHTATFTPRG